MPHGNDQSHTHGGGSKANYGKVGPLLAGGLGVVFLLLWIKSDDGNGDTADSEAGPSTEYVQQVQPVPTTVVYHERPSIIDRIFDTDEVVAVGEPAVLTKEIAGIECKPFQKDVPRNCPIGGDGSTYVFPEIPADRSSLAGYQFCLDYDGPIRYLSTDGSPGKVYDPSSPPSDALAYRFLPPPDLPEGEVRQALYWLGRECSASKKTGKA